MNQKLIVIGGIPGTGKSTLAKSLSNIMNLPVFSKDELEAAVARKGLALNKNMQGVGYEIMATLASSQIENGNGAIFDFIASKSRVDEFWPELFENEFKYIECVCSNEAIHKERIASRKRNIKGWYELSWSDILTIKNNYQPLMSGHLILDSVNDLNENIKLANNYVSQ